MSHFGRNVISPLDVTAPAALPSTPLTAAQMVDAGTGIVNVWSHGATGDGVTDDSAAFQAAHDALPSGGGILLVPSATGYLLNTQISCTKSVVWRIGNTTIVGPASGYTIELEANDSGIEGSQGTTFVATAGCTGVIHNDQTQRCHYWNFKIDPNTVQNAKIFHHDGGWYIDVKNVEILKDTEHATTVSLYIQSTNTGVAGATGSYGGAYVGTYENFVANTIQLAGDLPNKVTTITFLNPDTSGFIATDTVSITCLQPVVQKTGGTMFAFDNVSGWTNLGGDLEGDGSTIYSFENTCRGILSLGNQISGAGNIYFNGLPTANSRFLDDDTTAVTGIIKGNIGSAEPMEFGNYGYTLRHRSGIHYVGTEQTISANLKRTSATEADLDDISEGGMALSLNTSGQLVVHSATAGANPRTLSLGMQLDGLGLFVANIATYADNAAALAGGLTAGRFYKTGTGVLMIVY